MLKLVTTIGFVLMTFPVFASNQECQIRMERIADEARLSGILYASLVQKNNDVSAIKADKSHTDEALQAALDAASAVRYSYDQAWAEVSRITAEANTFCN